MSLYDKPKFVGTKHRWQMRPKARISANGRKAVEADPDLNVNTLQMLLETEGPMLSEESRTALEGAIAGKIDPAWCKKLLEDDRIGLVHLALCIGDNIDDSLASLAETYAEERQLPFIDAALLCLAALQENELKYFTHSLKTAKTTTAKWFPPETYVPPESTMPPVRDAYATRHRANIEPIEQYETEMDPCPYCKTPGVLMRAGERGYWTTCCTDPTQTCQNYYNTSTRIRRSPRQAVADWNWQARKIAKEEGRKNDGRK